MEICLMLRIRVYPTVSIATHTAKLMGPTWDPPGSCRPQVGPMLAQLTLLSGNVFQTTCPEQSIDPSWSHTSASIFLDSHNQSFNVFRIKWPHLSGHIHCRIMNFYLNHLNPDCIWWVQSFYGVLEYKLIFYCVTRHVLKIVICHSATGNITEASKL